MENGYWRQLTVPTTEGSQETTVVGLLLQALLLTAPAGRGDHSPAKASDYPEVTQPGPGEEPGTSLLHVYQAPARSCPVRACF